MKKRIMAALAATLVIVALLALPAAANYSYTYLGEAEGVQIIWVTPDNPSIGCGGGPAIAGKWRISRGRAVRQLMLYNFLDQETAEAAVTRSVVDRVKSIPAPPDGTTDRDNWMYTPFWECASTVGTVGVKEAPAKLLPDPLPDPPLRSAIASKEENRELRELRARVARLEATAAAEAAKSARCAQLAKLGFEDCDTAVQEFQQKIADAGGTITVDGHWGPETEKWYRKIMGTRQEAEEDCVLKAFKGDPCP